MTVAGVGTDAPIKCSRDVYIKPDMTLADATAKGPYDAVVVPGGMGGAENVANVSKYFCQEFTVVFCFCLHVCISVRFNVKTRFHAD